MGFDLNGVGEHLKRPNINWDNDKQVQEYFKWEKETPGAYFRNNSWWWRPLWQYVCLIADDILSDEQKKAGHYNDGMLIDEGTAKKIGERLDIALSSGDVKIYESARNSFMKYFKDKAFTSYYFNEDNVRKFKDFCLNSGGFTID